MTLKGLILDFDGVIVNSLTLHLEAWAQATEQIFRVRLEKPELLKGYATRTIASILAKRYGHPSLGPVLVKTKQALLLSKLPDLELLEGADCFVEEAKDKGLPIGIGSNSLRSFVEPATRTLGLGISVIVCGDDVNHPKPHPDTFRECAKRMGFGPSDYPQIAVFEDSAHGLRAATALGMIPYGITSEQSPRNLLEAGAIATFSHLGAARIVLDKDLRS